MPARCCPDLVTIRTQRGDVYKCFVMFSFVIEAITFGHMATLPPPYPPFSARWYHASVVILLRVSELVPNQNPQKNYT